MATRTKAACTCPTRDNSEAPPGMVWVDGGCPVHARLLTPEDIEATPLAQERFFPGMFDAMK